MDGSGQGAPAGTVLREINPAVTEPRNTSVAAAAHHALETRDTTGEVVLEP
ncbi:hypothetical protein ACFTZI_18590 [Streptomyces decoyicus]|uniref:hypothetical protein n=1 Tax=Streptomyces decoyicus TaxID=249567 RepID=UPI003637C80F